MGVFVRADSRYYWLTLERQGQRPIRRATRILVRAASPEQTRENRRLADLAYHAAMAELTRRGLGMTPQASPTLQQFLENRYRAWLLQDRGKTTAAETLRRLDELFVPAFGAYPLHAIRPAVVAQWRTARLASGVTAQTVDRDLAALRGLLRRAVEWDILDRHPLDTLHLPRTPGPQIVRYLTAEEETRLLAALEARDAEGRAARLRANTWRLQRQRPLLPAIRQYVDALTPLVLVSLHTGVRRGELFQLAWRAVDFQAAVLTVEWDTAKTRRTRRIELNAVARDALAAWREETGGRVGLVFPGPKGEPLVTVKHGWSALLTRAGIADFRWHDLRHTFASKLVQRGVSLQVVSRLLGHTSLQTTMRYAHLAPSQTRAAVDLLAPAREG